MHNAENCVSGNKVRSAVLKEHSAVFEGIECMHVILANSSYITLLCMLHNKISHLYYVTHNIAN